MRRVVLFVCGLCWLFPSVVQANTCATLLTTAPVVDFELSPYGFRDTFAVQWVHGRAVARPYGPMASAAYDTEPAWDAIWTEPTLPLLVLDLERPRSLERYPVLPFAGSSAPQDDALLLLKGNAAQDALWLVRHAWGSDEPTRVCKFPRHTLVRFTGDGRHLFYVEDKELVLVRADGTEAWRKELRGQAEWTNGIGAITGVVVSPRAESIAVVHAASGTYLVNGDYASPKRVSDRRDGSLAAFASSRRLVAFSDPDALLDMRPAGISGRTFVGRVTVVDANTADVVATIPLENGVLALDFMHGFSETVLGVATDGGVTFWNLRNEGDVAVPAPGAPLDAVLRAQVEAPSEIGLASAAFGKATDPHLLLTAFQNGRAIVWNGNLEPVAVMDGVGRLSRSWAKAANRFASIDGNVFRLWDLPKPTPLSADVFETVAPHWRITRPQTTPHAIVRVEGHR